MNPQIWWFLARASGLVAWGLLTLTVLLGVLLRTRFLPPSRTANLFPLHRFLAGLAVLFTAGHLAGLLLDGYIDFGPADVFIPFAASWRPIPVALGVLALYLMIAVAVTSAVMRRLPRRWWSAIHCSAYAMFWSATIHAVTAGTDATSPVAMVFLAAASGAVLFATVVRVLSPNPTPVRAVPAAVDAMHRLTVRQVEEQGPDAVSVSIGVPPAQRETFRAVPGQHVLVRRPGDDATGARPYSVYAADAEAIRIAVRRVPGGHTSPWVTGLRPGDQVEVSAPRGTFGTAPDPVRRRHVLAVGAGSGVTPLIAIASAVLGLEPESRVTFLLANRSPDRIMLRRELDELAQQYPHRLRLVHVLDQDAQAPQLAGPLDATLLHRLGARLDIAGVDEAYLCGPGPLTESVRLGLTDLGVDPGRISCEQFSAPIPAARSASVGAVTTGAPASCTVVIGGRSVRITGEPSESVLDAGLRAGLPLPYSCRAGYCGTCEAVVTPATDLDGQAPGEVVRTCQTSCPSTAVTVDFDRVADRATAKPR